jgi:hypothetical protein
LQPLAPFRIAEDGDKLVVISAGGELDFKPEQRAALERALNGPKFTPTDLGEGGEALTAKLFSYGLIART